jgi:hypothetical protein
MQFVYCNLIWSNIYYFRAKIMYAILLEYLGKIACNFKQEGLKYNTHEVTKFSREGGGGNMFSIERPSGLDSL